MKVNGDFVAGENRVKQNGRHLDAEILVIERHFAVAREHSVCPERRVDRHRHRVRLAVKRQETGHDPRAFVGIGYHRTDDAVALESDGRILIRLERFFGDGSITRHVIAAIAGCVDQHPHLSRARNVGGIDAYCAVNYAERPTALPRMNAAGSATDALTVLRSTSTLKCIVAARAAAASKTMSANAPAIAATRRARTPRISSEYIFN